MNRQEAASTSHPPSSGPAAPATAARPDQAPMARPRSEGSKPDEMIDRLAGTSSAPATPWSARAAMRKPTPGANPHSTEAATKPARPATNTRRRPYRSPALPPSRSSDDSVTR